MLFQGLQTWHVDDNSSPEPAQLTRYEAETLYMVWITRESSELEVAVAVAPNRPQRGLSGNATNRNTPHGPAIMSDLSTVLMRYF